MDGRVPVRLPGSTKLWTRRLWLAPQPLQATRRLCPGSIRRMRQEHSFPSVLIEKFVELSTRISISRVPCAHDEAAMRGRPKSELVLSEAERERLVSFTLWRARHGALGQDLRLQLCAVAPALATDLSSHRVQLFVNWT